MVEAAVEDAGIEELVEEQDEPVERATGREDYAGSITNGGEYETEARRSNARNSAYKKSENKQENKKSSVSREDLEGLIERDDDAPFARDEDGNILVLYKGKRVYGEGYSAPTRFKGKKSGKSEAREVHDSFDGGHVIIAYKNPETGELCFSFEKKPRDYPIINGEKNAGKLSLYGGSLKIGEPANEGTAREIGEEDPKSYDIVIKALNETRWKVAEVNKHVDGVPSTTYVWLAYIKDPAEVRNYISSKTLEGAKTFLSLNEVVKTKDSDFAFGFGPIVKGAGITLANMLYSQYN